MKIPIAILSLFFLITQNLFSQAPRWVTLTNAPVADSGVDRFDDSYFINSTTGWIVQGTAYFLQHDTGKVYKTIDGGYNWTLTNHKIPQYLRSVGFFNSNTGIIGTIDDSLHILFRTTDGGYNWTDITNYIQGTKPSAICGISIVDSTTAFACGRYYCPANVIKTTNAGLNWISLPIDTSLVRSLVDCYFWSPDSGMVVGGYSPVNLYYQGKSVVLVTTNGGINWTRVYISSRFNEWCWKIQFVNRQIGFVSIERVGPPTNILKTTNGGFNWQEISLPSNITNIEGVGFLNSNTGWVGGWGTDFNMPNYETTNGGANWHLAGWGLNMNRIRFLNDTLAYSVGKTVYKYTSESVGINLISSEIPSSYKLFQNYPNPFNPVTVIRYSLPVNRFISIKVYEVLGNEVATLVNEKQNAGSYEVEFDGANYPSGVYFYRLQTESFSETKMMTLLK